MAGLSVNGLEIKRLGEVIADLREDAQPIFQDLVPPGDVVDTSDSSTIGRLIALQSVPIADLWEAIQQVYLAFDPNSATGVALDNLVMYGGLSRSPASATTATVVVWGNEGVFIPVGQTVRALDNTLYDISIGVSLDRTRNNGFVAEIPEVVVGRVYTISILSGQTTINASVTAVSASTKQSLTASLVSQLNSNASINAIVVGETLQVTAVDILEYWNVTPTNVTINKIRTRTEVRNQVVGAKEQEANTITAIATPMLGWDSVNNPFAAVTGENQETDEELRVRFRDSKFLRAQNISDALYSSLIAIDGVRYAAVFENESGTYDPVYNLNEHSFKAVVLGGSPADIAQAIWRNKPLGIGAEGNTFATIFDSQGFPRDIYFERPTNVPVYIRMTLSVDANTFPSDGVDRIKAALVDYFENNFTIGQDVVYSRLYTPINSIPGHQVNSLTIGTTPNPTGTANIVVPYNGIAYLDSNNIQITIA